jgi:putative ABC transport system permease protein
VSISTNLELIISNTFLDSIAAKGGVNSLGVNVEEGMDEPLNETISAIVKERGLAMGSALEARRAQEEARFTVTVLGGAISGILALIGLFNFINLISVGLLNRKREFAALESVGMSKKQTRSVLRWEGAFYWLLAIAASLTAGTGAAYGLFLLVYNQNPALFPHFAYPFLPVAAVFALIITICTVTPEACYRGISKATLVERLREAE